MTKKKLVISADSVIICTQGDILGREYEISTKMLSQSVANFNLSKYQPKINLEHFGFTDLGTVKKIWLDDHPEVKNKKALFAKLDFTTSYVEMRKRDLGSTFSVEMEDTTQGWMLTGLAITNNPAALATTHIELNKNPLKNNDMSTNLNNNDVAHLEKTANLDNEEKISLTKPLTKPATLTVSKTITPAKTLAKPKKTSIEKDNQLVAPQNLSTKETKGKEELNPIDFCYNAESKNESSDQLSANERAMYAPDLCNLVLKKMLTPSFNEVSPNRFNLALSPIGSNTAGAAESIFNEMQALNNVLKNVNLLQVGAKAGKKFGLFTAGRALQRKRNKEFTNILDSSFSNYETEWVEYNFEAPFSLIDSWRHLSDLVPRLRSLWLEHRARDMADLTLLGEAKLINAQKFVDIDFSFKNLYRKEYNQNLISAYATKEGETSKAILIGKQVSIKLNGVVVNKANNKVAIPYLGLRPAKGGLITISGTTNYDGTFVVEQGTTAAELFINSKFSGETIANGTAEQNPDFANLDQFVSLLKSELGSQYRSNGLVLWVSDSLVLESEKRAFSSISSATPSEKGFVNSSLYSYASIPATTIYNMPAGDIYLGAPNNLSIYTLANSERVEIKEMDMSRRAMTSSTYVEQCNVVENYKAGIFAENVKLIGVAGFEPATTCSQSRYASQAALHPVLLI